MRNLTPEKIVKGFSKTKDPKRYISLILRNNQVLVLGSVCRSMVDIYRTSKRLAKTTRGMERRNHKATANFVRAFYMQLKGTIAFIIRSSKKKGKKNVKSK